MRPPSRHPWLSAGAALLIATVLVPAAGASTIRVTTTADAAGAGRACSLREALVAAARHAAFGGCRAGSGTSAVPDVVAVGAGTYRLSRRREGAGPLTGDLLMAGDVVLRGAGARSTTIDAAGRDRAISVVNGGNVLAGVTVRGGRAPAATPPRPAATGRDGAGGGGVLVGPGATLTIRDSTLARNVAGRGGNGGTGVLAPGELAPDAGHGGGGGRGGDGGAALVLGRARLVRVTLRDNAAGDGGRGGTGGRAATCTGDPSSSEGSIGGDGGAAGDGGGLAVEGDGSATLTDVTVTGNRAGLPGIAGPGATQARLCAVNFPGTPGYSGVGASGPGMFERGGVLSLTAVTVAFNAGGAIGRTEGSLALTGSLVSGSCRIMGAAPVLRGANLGDSPSCPGRTAARLRLAAPADNGGPTDTIAPRPGSPAIDAGGRCPALDQRGRRRPRGRACDAGALETAP